MTEAEFQAQVVELAGVCGWRVLHVRHSIGRGEAWTTATNVVGWPDLFCWHPRRRRFFAAELKSQDGKATPEQLAVLQSLEQSGIPAHLWRPADWDEIKAVLTDRTVAAA